MARLPSWKDQQGQSYTGARKWGSGINPIHSKPSAGPGRNLAPGPYSPGDTGLVGDFDYVTEGGDAYAGMEGVDLTYTDAHPNLGDPSTRGNTRGYPSWGSGWGSEVLRGTKVGMAWKENEALQKPQGIAGGGWVNKRHGEVLDSRSADESQLYIMTSMVQRDKVKTNDLAVARGTDDARHGIATRLTGMKVKEYADATSDRHEAMFPFQQEYRTRPFKYRTAGVGNAADMAVNEMYVSEPMQRTVPADVNQGSEETSFTGGAYDDYIGDDWYA